jgi:uncharacterized protein YicC (UPF0701 family)
MTGYGKASAEFQGKKITAEVKSLNSKALDLSTRIASVYREKEMEVRAMLTQSLERKNRRAGTTVVPVMG